MAEKQEIKSIPEQVIKPQKVNSSEKTTPNKEEMLKALLNAFSSSDSETQRMILKELFRDNNIKMITEVSDREINIISRGFFYSQFFYEHGYIEVSNTLNKYFGEFLTLRVSRLRQSRREFYDTYKIENMLINDEKRMSDKVKS